MGLLARVRSDVAGLVLEAVESLFAQRTLVGTRKLCPLILHVIVAHIHGRHQGTQIATVADVVVVIHGGEPFVLLERHGPVD